MTADAEVWPLVTVPVCAMGSPQPVGVLQIGGKASGGVFDGDDEMVVQLAADLIKVRAVRSGRRTNNALPTTEFP